MILISTHLQSRCLTFQIVQLKQCLTSGNNSRILSMTSGLPGDLLNYSPSHPQTLKRKARKGILSRLVLGDKAEQTPSYSGANYNPD